MKTPYTRPYIVLAVMGVFLLFAAYLMFIRTTDDTSGAGGGRLVVYPTPIPPYSTTQASPTPTIDRFHPDLTTCTLIGEYRALPVYTCDYDSATTCACYTGGKIYIYELKNSPGSKFMCGLSNVVPFTNNIYDHEYCHYYREINNLTTNDSVTEELACATAKY